LLAYGGAMRSVTGKRADDAVPNVTASEDAIDDYRAAGRRTGNGLMIGGGIALAIGVGLAAWGITRLVRHRSASRTAAWRFPAFVPRPL
jgi:hypothetical protein